MEDYDVFTEMNSINKKIVMIVEDNEKLFYDIASYCEVMPLRFSYDLSNFNNTYIEDTKKLFSYYYEHNNSYQNELARIKKHFIHYSRYPFILYINKHHKYYDLISNLCNDLNIECVFDKFLFIEKVKNNKKIFLIDSDGTLKNSKGLISENNKKAIKKIKDADDYAIICTARPRYHTMQVSNECGASDYIISFNGGEIYDINNEKVIKASTINKSLVYKIIDSCNKLDLRLVISTDEFDFVTKKIRNDSQKLLEKDYRKQIENYDVYTLMIIDDKKDVVESFKNSLKEYDNVEIINESNDECNEAWFTIGNKYSNKGDALTSIADCLRVPLCNVVSIGNDYNDIAMFKKSGVSFAVSNSDYNIKRYADYVVSSNDHSPIMDMIDIVYR